MPRRNVNVKMVVQRALMCGRKLTWSQLLNHTGVSAGALSPHLNQLIKMEYVDREVDTTTRPPTTYYKLTPEGWRRQKLWPKAWNDEMQKTQKLLNVILELNLHDKRRLQDLVSKYIKLEEWEQEERKRTHEIIESGDNLVLRNRKTGRIVAVIKPGFPENDKKNREFVHG